MSRRAAALWLAAATSLALAAGILVRLRAPIVTTLKQLPHRWLASEPDPPREARATLRCERESRKISPLIFGVSGGGPRELRAKADRLGGNGMSRYNWRLGDAWNTGVDWYFRNVKLTYSYKSFIDAGSERGQALALTLPMLGWVAKDRVSYSFPVATFGPQQSLDPEHPDIGNGIAPDGGALAAGAPDRTSVRMGPEDIGSWVEAIRRDDAARGRRAIHEYMLDNELGLWNVTQRDVHPEPVSYDELVERTIAYGRAVRKADRDALIAGPAAWGYWEYFFSAADARAGFRDKPDRLAHGDVPLLAYYLRKLREHEQRTGERILDILDVHYYPQAKAVFAPGGGGAVDAASAALRVRATRSLWDAEYVDESWIAEPVRLLPRMQELIANEYPSSRLSIGEWNFGGETHISGGLAVAETLGRFAEHGVYSAFYWTVPKPDSPAYWGFRAYTNYDGEGGSFLDEYVESEMPSGLSVFASRNSDHTRLVVVVINLNPRVERSLTLDASSCGKVASLRRFDYGPGSTAISAGPKIAGPLRELAIAPYSWSVLEISNE